MGLFIIEYPRVTRFPICQALTPLAPQITAPNPAGVVMALDVVMFAVAKVKLATTTVLTVLVPVFVNTVVEQASSKVIKS
jgi:hypothetical protein